MSRPLNFLHLTTFYPPYHFGGDGMQVYRLAHALAENGHHVDVIHCVDAYHLSHPAPPPLEFAEHPNVTRHELRSGLGWLSPLAAQQTGRTWLKRTSVDQILKSRPFDVVHFHNISLLGPEILSIEPQRGQAVKLYTAHEHWLVCPLHVLWKFNRAPCDRPECLRCVVEAKRPPQAWRYTGLLDRMARHVDQFIAPSSFTLRMHADRGFAQPMERVPNFVDRADAEWQNPAPRPQDAPYFLFVGRLEAIKGVQTLIAMWDRVPTHDLLIAGAGNYEEKLRVMAAGNPRIRFLGPLAQSELGKLYYHAAACIVPSLAYETFGLTAVEAFARKTPVVARDLGALREIMEESGGGFLYRNDAELADALERIAHSPELRRELGEKGYEAFVRRWSREAHLRLYFDCLERVAREKFGRVPWLES